MIKSMTGYGKSVGEYEGKRITVELKSLNSKQLDLLVKLPSLYREREMALRQELAQLIDRGKVDFSITVEHVGKDVVPQLNVSAIEGYCEQIKDIAQQVQIELPRDWFATLLTMPEVFKGEQSELTEEEWEAVHGVVMDAVSQFQQFRTQEGESLNRMFRQKIDNIEAYLCEVEQYEGERVERIKSHLRDNLEALRVDYDKNRFEQELIFYIEKLDINEEKVRLRNHLRYFLETMEQECANGKKLGFVAQEMGREINTLGSKSNHSQMQILVVKMKDELEQIKEQVLNVL